MYIDDVMKMYITNNEKNKSNIFVLKKTMQLKSVLSLDKLKQYQLRFV